MEHRLTLREIAPVTHDTYRLVFERPGGFAFEPGQAVDMALDRDGWRDETRPYTMTCLPDAEELEFVIKSYPDHDGVSCRITQLAPGDHVLSGAPRGALTDKGPGIYIAAGTGITPMIGLLRNRAQDQEAMNGCTLIFANKRERDIILRDEWEGMRGLTTLYALEEEDVPGMHHGRLERDYIEEVIRGSRDNFYVCGPPEMEEAVTGILREMGVPQHKVMTDR